MSGADLCYWSVAVFGDEDYCSRILLLGVWQGPEVSRRGRHLYNSLESESEFYIYFVPNTTLKKAPEHPPGHSHLSESGTTTRDGQMRMNTAVTPETQYRRNKYQHEATRH